ncbi:MAG: Bug family tripartite tricarboxylate transporter substrate binding protein [Variibacter sp.]
MSMKINRRAMLRGAAGAMVLPAAFAKAARADTWPSRPVKVIVGYPAGGANDLVARTVAQEMGEKLNGNFIVDNRSGAAGAIGAEVAAKSPPDGYTLYMMSSSQVLAPSIKKSLPYDPVKDFSAITLCASSSYILCVHPSVPVKTLAELVDYAKKNPGKLNYASSGIGAGPHLASALFVARAGIKMTHVPYRGDTPAITDLLAGQVQMYFMSIAPGIPHIQSGAVRPIAIASAKRSSIFPDIPSVAEQGYPGFDVGAWWGLVAPAGTPKDVISRSEAVVLPFLKKPATVERFKQLALDPGELGADAFQKFIASEQTRLANIVKQAGIEAE